MATDVSALARHLSAAHLDTFADRPEAWPWTGFRPVAPRRPAPRPGIGHDVIAARLDALMPRDGVVGLLMRGAALAGEP